MEEHFTAEATANTEEGEKGDYFYLKGYDANTYADYSQQGEHVYQEEGDYYTTYQQEGYEGYYLKQESGQEGDTYHDTSTEGYDTYTPAEGQDYSYYNSDDYASEQQSYATGTTETWSYSPEDGHELYWDQLTTEQTAGYYYDEQGNLITGYETAESPTNVFKQEGYWETEQDNNSSPYTGDTSSSATREGSPQDETDTDGLGTTDSSPLDSGTTDGPESVATPEGTSPRKTKNKNGRATSPSKKRKTKKKRVQQRQAALEKEEEERIKALEAAEAAGANDNAPEHNNIASAKPGKPTSKKTGFVGREKAKFQLRLRIAKAIKRKRMPVQIRILPKTRKYLSPMEKYFGSKSVECVLSDIFWSSMKGDLKRVKHLVEIEGESPTDSKLDPWNLHQTPLHWAAKGGSVPVVNYLLAAGARPRTLDGNGSLPLHLSCWAGHVDASIILLRASDVKDLYVQDYDGAMCALDWVNVRGHTKLLKAIEKYQDSLWLPKFVDDLIRGIVRYKIKIFKDPPTKPVKAAAKGDLGNDQASTDTATGDLPVTTAAEKNCEKPGESPAEDAAVPTADSSKKSLLKRATTEKVDRKLAAKDKTASSKSLG